MVSTNLFLKMSSMLDNLSDNLQSSDLLKEAYELDRISNSIDIMAADSYSRMNLKDIISSIREDEAARFTLFF